MEPKNTPLVGGKLVLTNLEKIMLKALEEADVAFAVFNITDLTPQARGCLVKTWPLVQDAIMEVKGKNSIYAEAVRMAREEDAKRGISLSNWVRSDISPS